MKRFFGFLVAVSLFLFSSIALAQGASQVTLAWDAVTQHTDGTPATDLVGYRLYQSATAGQYTFGAANAKGSINAPTTTLTLTGIVDGTWYFVVTAFSNTSESAKSNEISRTFDTTPPVVSVFLIPTTYGALTVPITTLTATDVTGVTGYLINENSATPSLTDPGWTATKPTSYTFLSTGAKTLYAWAKDGYSNISAGRSATITITVPPPAAPTGLRFAP